VTRRMSATLEEEWVRYFGTMLHCQMDRAVTREARRAFYAGAAVCLLMLGESATAPTDASDKTGEMFGRLRREVAEFFALREQGIV
jgi:hypothetical protein